MNRFPLLSSISLPLSLAGRGGACSLRFSEFRLKPHTISSSCSSSRQPMTSLFQKCQQWFLRKQNNTMSSADSFRFSIDRLETRNMLSTSIEIDYTFDTEGFFDDQTRRDALEEVAADISSRLGDSLTAITPSGDNAYALRFFHPATDEVANWVINPTIEADKIIVYAGGRDLGRGVLGRAGPGTVAASGDSAFL